jgi:hypothetical protein
MFFYGRQIIGRQGVHQASIIREMSGSTFAGLFFNPILFIDVFVVLLFYLFTSREIKSSSFVFFNEMSKIKIAYTKSNKENMKEKKNQKI